MTRALFFLWFPLSALAGDTSEDAHLEILAGAGYPPGTDDPASVRLSVRGEVPVLTGEAVALTGVVPVGFDITGRDGFGFDVHTTVIEVAPSARLRFANASPVRPYLDAGFGPAFRVQRTDTIFGDAEDNAIGWTSRATVGLQIGGAERGQAAFVVEPFSWRSFRFGDAQTHRFVAQLGLSVPL